MSTQGYAFTFEHGTFTPEGKVQLTCTPEEHNARLTRDELAAWAHAPEQWSVYVSDPETYYYPHNGHSGRCDKGTATTGNVTTWTGAVLGTVTLRRTFRNNFGARITCIRFKGTNGAEYYGRYGADWSQLCNVRKVRT